MTTCAKCGRECAKDPRHGIMQWCAKCPPSGQPGLNAYTVGSNTNWRGGRVKPLPDADTQANEEK